MICVYVYSYWSRERDRERERERQKVRYCACIYVSYIHMYIWSIYTYFTSIWYIHIYMHIHICAVTLQHTHYLVEIDDFYCNWWKRNFVCCLAMQHAATQCCNTLQNVASSRQHTAAHCGNTLQRMATHSLPWRWWSCHCTRWRMPPRPPPHTTLPWPSRHICRLQMWE